MRSPWRSLLPGPGCAEAAKRRIARSLTAHQNIICTVGFATNLGQRKPSLADLLSRQVGVAQPGGPEDHSAIGAVFLAPRHATPRNAIDKSGWLSLVERRTHRRWRPSKLCDIRRPGVQSPPPTPFFTRLMQGTRVEGWKGAAARTTQGWSERSARRHGRRAGDRRSLAPVAREAFLVELLSKKFGSSPPRHHPIVEGCRVQGSGCRVLVRGTAESAPLFSSNFFS